jgi:asparagine synthase (glutamine-hydrolysing)
MRDLLRGPAPSVARAVHAESLTYLEESALHDLHDETRAAERAAREGLLIEVGCALGGSAIVIAAAKAPGRRFEVYDVFGMPPGPSAGDGPDVQARWAVIASGQSPGISGGRYYGYVDDLLGRVRDNFRRHGVEPEATNVRFVKGLVQDTLVLGEPVAFAHVDCDRYESVRTSLERIAPRLVAGGVMVIDDYDHRSGCRKAVDEYLRVDGSLVRRRGRSRLHLVRS